MALSRSRVEDQQLGPNVDDRLRRVPDPTIPGVLSPTNRAGQLRPGGRLDVDRWVDNSAICFGKLL
jgi:hypothetical protein